jgi:hypothetical protein
MKHETLPEVGQKVIGKHILGKSYSGVITGRRPYYGNNDQVYFDIAFDKPTLLAENDIREVICLDVDYPMKGDKKWQDGHGGWFEVAE